LEYPYSILNPLKPTLTGLKFKPVNGPVNGIEGYCLFCSTVCSVLCCIIKKKNKKRKKKQTTGKTQNSTFLNQNILVRFWSELVLLIPVTGLREIKIREGYPEISFFFHFSYFNFNYRYYFRYF
jgi:hypothetical protein